MRGFLRGLGRLILPIFFKIRITGQENFPKDGPIILVGNHNAAMEGVLMVVYSPWQVEMLGAGDIPQEMITEFFEAIYQYIPIRRGHADRPALQKALDVLAQGGCWEFSPRGECGTPAEGAAMQTGLEELLRLARWADENGYSPTITPIWRYYDKQGREEIIQARQQMVTSWM